MFRKELLMIILLQFATSIVIADNAGNERADYIRANYTKYEYKIPMRDGMKLFTTVYLPNGRSQKYPILLLRTPYSVGPYGADQYKNWLGPYEEFEKEGFIFVFQDVRGKFMSEGEFINMRPHNPNKKSNRDVDESTDTYDTIEWLLENIDNHNEKVGQWGISYPGFYSSAGMIDSHPALKAVSPQAPIADWFWDDMHHHGAFILNMTFNFFSSFGQKRDSLTTEWPERFDHKIPDGYQFFLDLGPLKNVNEKYFNRKIDFWNKMVEHPNYDDFWQVRNILPHLKDINAAVMVVGGWFDAEDLYGPLKTYQEIERNNPGIFNVLVMGPWFHGGWTRSDGKTLGDADFGFKTSKYYQDHVCLRFFQHYLRGGKGKLDFPEALVFETGANRWLMFDAWPPKRLQNKKLFMHADSYLSFDEPEDEGDTYDSYISDPSKPVPYTMEITNSLSRDYMTEDQRYAAWRPDVLVYRTEVLKDDISLAGPIKANLFVSTTGTDSDWIVKLIDVYPNQMATSEENSDEPDRGAQQMMIRGEVFRGRFRESYQHPKPFVSNKVTLVSFELQDILHTFKSGHRIMIQVQSTWFPLVGRNPQTYVPNIFKAKEKDFITVTNRIYRSKRYPSNIEVGILQ